MGRRMNNTVRRSAMISSIVTQSVPQFKAGILILMVIGGIAGGICGRAINKKIEAKTVDKLFIGLIAEKLSCNFPQYLIFL